MFNFFRKKTTKENLPSKIGNSLNQNLSKFFANFGSWIELFQTELHVVIAKCKNLQETNYNLGLKHLNNGRIAEATFRFRFTKKFWPECYEAYYQLAYCFTLDNRLEEAKITLEELLSKKPDHEKAKDLLNNVNTKIQNKAS